VHNPGIGAVEVLAACRPPAAALAAVGDHDVTGELTQYDLFNSAI